jgi:hypothetical protein
MPKTGDKRTPTSWSEVHDKRWLRSEHLQGKKPTLKISEVHQEVLDQGSGPYETLIRFEGKEKELVLNVTNKKCLRALFGDRPQEWVGCRIVLCTEQTHSPDGVCEGIRIWGSPDIETDVKVSERLGRGRLTRTLKRTGNGGSPSTSRSGK